MTLCYLGLGSNLRTPERQLRQAITSLHNLPRTAILKCSELYFSQAFGMRGQPNYCNLVLALQTSLSAKQLLHYIHKIEAKHLRVRKKRWGPRTLDIDILLFGEHDINQHNLTIPHPRMLERDFVLVPLLEIAPEVMLPDGQRVRNPSCDR